VNALNAPEVAQTSRNTPWCAPTPPIRVSCQASNKGDDDDGQCSAGPSGGGIDESRHLDISDLEESVGLEGSGGEIETMQWRQKKWVG
jgi:hypothetical protein